MKVLKLILFLAVGASVVIGGYWLRYPQGANETAGVKVEEVLGVKGVKWDVSISARAMHSDEAVNARKFSALLEEGNYKYDPKHFHGPALPYATLGYAKAKNIDKYVDTDEAFYREVILLFGMTLIVLTLLAAMGLGLGAALAAAVLCAVSPAMVFFSQYHIHEMLLVVFTFGAILFGLAYAKHRFAGWAIGCGVCLGLMHATKETGVIAGGCMLLALAVSAIVPVRWKRPKYVGIEDEDWEEREAEAKAQVENAEQKKVNWWHMNWGFLSAVVVVVVLFSSFFTNWGGVVDSVTTYKVYLERAKGEGDSKLFPIHTHETWWYMNLLWEYPEAPPLPKAKPGKADSKGTAAKKKPTRIFFSEKLILILAGIGGLFGLTGIGIREKHRRFSRFMVLYTGLMILVYSFIPYKTPWTMLSFLHGMIVVAGIGVGVIGGLLLRWRWAWIKGGLAIGVGVTLALASGAGGYALWDGWWDRVLDAIGRVEGWMIGVAAISVTGLLALDLIIRRNGIAGSVAWLAAILALGLGAYELGRQAWLGSYHPAYLIESRNPYVYAHSTPDVKRYSTHIKAVEKIMGDEEVTIWIFDPGIIEPLPFYLRNYPVKYFPKGFPSEVTAAFLIVEPDAISNEEYEKLTEKYTDQRMGIRPQDYRLLFTRQDLFEKWVETQ